VAQLNVVQTGPGRWRTEFPVSEAGAYLVIQQLNVNPDITPALTVNGNELLNGNLEVANGDIHTNQGVQATFVSACAVDAGPGGVINGIATVNGGKMMWNKLAPGEGRTEFLNARAGAAASVGFAWYAGPNGATAQPPIGSAQNLGYWDVGGLSVSTPLNAPGVITLGSTTLAAFNSTGNSLLSGGASLSVSGTVTAQDLIASSDVRLKNDIQTIDSALDKVMRMRGVYFNRTNEDGRRTGVIAQEVEEVLPEVVYTDDTEDKMKSVSYGSMIGLLIEAIKEQQEIIKRLQE